MRWWEDLYETSPAYKWQPASCFTLSAAPGSAQPPGTGGKGNRLKGSLRNKEPSQSPSNLQRPQQTAPPPPPRSPGASNLTLKNLEKVIYGQSTKKLVRTWKLKAGHALKITKQIEKEEGRPRKITSAPAAARNGYCIKPSDKKQLWFSLHYPCWQFFNLTLCVKIQANGFSALLSSQQTGHGLDSRDLFLISHNNSE